jgi:N-acetylglucosamine-6-sulfatase
MRWLWCCGVGVLSVVFAVAHDSHPAAAARPNVVVVLVDDLEMGTFRTMLAKGLLPNIKSRLVDQGWTFDNSFVSDSLCCPSRATFLSGQYPHNNHVKSNIPPDGGVTAFDDRSSLATWLQGAGYWTGLVGKYLNSYGRDPTAPVTSSLNPQYVPPGWSDWQGFTDPGAYTAYDYIVNVNGTLVDHRPFGEVFWNYHTDMVTLRDLRFFDRAVTGHGTQPFFLLSTPISPHYHLVDRDHATIYEECPGAGGMQAPFNSGNLFGMTLRPAARFANTVFGDTTNYLLPQPPNFNEADVSDKPAWIQSRPLLGPIDLDCLQKQYWRRIEAMRAVDDQVGSIFSYTDSKGLTANTVFIFTSDNGYMMGEHRLTEKLVPYEESIRVPLVMRVPWDTSAHHVTDAALNNDLAPTIAAIAQAAPGRPVDGRSLLPILQGTSLPPRNEFLVEQFTGGPDAANPLFVKAFGDFPLLPSPVFTIRLINPPRMYSLYDMGAREYYDLSADPYELNNVASDPARQAEIQQLNNLLNYMKTCAGSVSCGIVESFFTLK